MNYSTDDNDDRYDFWDYCGDKMAEEEPEADEPSRCQSCGCETAEFVTAVWDSRLQVCAACEFPEEPECECAMSGDSYDPRGCELHDASSPWNVRMAAIREDAAALVAPILPQLEAAVERKREAGRADDLLCHFSGCGIWVNEGCDCMYGEVA